MDDLSLKVLVADDEYWIRENLRNLLDWRENSFVLLEPVEDGELALKAIRGQRPDIVITDINMPFVSGAELIEKAGAEFPDTAFIALSGYSDYQNVRAALVAGAIDYLLKPVSKADLLEVLSKAVGIIANWRKRQQELSAMRERLHQASMSADDRELSRFLSRTSDAKRSGSVRGVAAQVQKYIDENYFEDLSLASLSQQFAVESSYLSKVFKTAAGENLNLYIAQKRMERAKEYLKQKQYGIAEISRLVGYGDYAYFSRVFRKLCGVSPSEYREGALKPCER